MHSRIFQSKSLRSRLKDGVRLLTQKELESYFHRIQADEKSIQQFLSGPSLESLCEIHRLQTMNIHVTNYAMQATHRARENYLISPHFNDIFQKIVLQGHHGYCFENNQLLRHVLVNLGYKVNFYNAHIIRDNIPKQDPQHAILVVEMNHKKYLVDAGYGGVTPIAVTEFNLDVSQAGAGKTWTTTHPSGNQYKLSSTLHKFDPAKEEQGLILLHQQADKHWQPLYLFQEKPLSFKALAKANYHVSKDEKTTPFQTKLFETFFMKNDTRVSLTQNQFSVKQGEKILVSESIHNEKEYKDHLKKYFNYSTDQLANMGTIRKRVLFSEEPEQKTFRR